MKKPMMNILIQIMTIMTTTLPTVNARYDQIETLARTFAGDILCA